MSRGRKSKKDNLLTALKQAILQQAIQGKLTTDWRAENPDVEPASELLKRIQAEKQKLIDEKKIRKEKSLPEISTEEIPFDLPDGWVWCRLGEICTKLTDGFHHTPKKRSSGYRYISPKNLKNNKVIWSTCDFIDKEDHDYLQKKVKTEKGNILIANRGTVGTPAIVDTEEQFSFQNLALIGFNQKEINSKYIYNYLLSKKQEVLDFFANGGLQPMLSNKILKTLSLSLPPLPEQTAIVQKVEALMQKCDALEKGESIQHYPAINEPADQLLNRYAVGRQLLAELPQQQAQVKQLKQAILQEAIQGKLTADWRAENPDAEPASELLKRIKAEKQKLIDEKKIRKEKPLPAISAEEIPFDLPEGWVWCRVGQLGVINRGKSPKYNKEGENIILNQKCVRWFHVETQHCKTISLDWYETLPDEIKTAVNDILINSTGEGTIGRSAIVDENSAGLLFDSHVLRFRTTIESPYIMTLINSDFGQNQINDLKGAKSTKQTELGVNNLSNMIFPLAPMLEQKKLVQKVEALMQTCTDLEAQIKQSETHATQLMQAVIKEAFEAEKAIAKP